MTTGASCSPTACRRGVHGPDFQQGVRRVGSDPRGRGDGGGVSGSAPPLPPGEHPGKQLPAAAPILPESPIRLRAMHHPLDLHNVARRLINEQHPPITDADAQRIAQSLEADRPHGRFFPSRQVLPLTGGSSMVRLILPRTRRRVGASSRLRSRSARRVNRSVGLKGPAPAPLPPGCVSAPPRNPLAPP